VAVSMDVLTADLAAESAALRVLLEPLPGPDWRRATPAAGWAVADQITGDKWNRYIFRTSRNSSQDAISNAVAIGKPGVTIATLGQERYARRIAVAIDRERAQRPLTRTRALAELIERAVPTREPGKHAATRTFQALRMWINDELGQLRHALEQALSLLAPGGRLAVISFHSLEDGVVRDFFARHSHVAPELARLPVVPPSARPRLRLVGRKQRASAAEVAANPRARSALLRVAAVVEAEPA